MSKDRPRTKGFTLIEVLVAVTLIGVGVSACMTALSRMTQTNIRARDSERMQRLAVQKYDELNVSGQLTGSTQGGDFSDRNLDDYEWTVTTGPTGVDSLTYATLTVKHKGADDSTGVSIDGMFYVPTTATPTGTTGQ